MIVLSIIAALLILAAALFLTIWVYLKMRKYFSRNKVLNEVIVIAFAIVVSFFIKGAVVLSVSEITGFGEGLAAVWYVMYSTIGGLSFEGIDASADLGVTVVLKCLYYGAAVYAAVTSLSIISVGVSYEFFTYVKVLLFPRTYSTLYIFTDVSEESLLMAKSIYAAEKAKERKRGEKFAVIFMGSGLEAFDRKSDVHREIVNYGFYYWSYSKSHNPEKEVSLLKKLHYKKSRCEKRDNGANHNKMVHIFSLKSDENLYAAENLNSSLLFDDMAAVLRDYCGGEGDAFVNDIPTVINYYVMTQSDVNYEFYKAMRLQTVEALLAKVNLAEDRQKGVKNQLLNTFQIHIISEAQLYADDLSKQLRAQATGQHWDAALCDEKIMQYHNLLQPDKDGFYRTAVYGFGKAGQHALAELFIATSAFCDKDYMCPSKFIADVYDGNMREISGEFSYNHPMFICKNSYGDTVPQNSAELYEWSKTVDSEALRAVYSHLPKELEKYGKNAQEAAHTLMGYPIVAMHESSCFEMDFMKDADSHSAGIYDKNGVYYRSFVISMGNDESNLLMANILIDDCRHEVNLSGNVHTDGPVVIFVHIRDEKNTPRLNWTAEDKKNMASNLVVVPFGCRETIWSYENIVDDDKDSIFNYGYHLNNGKLLEGEKIIKQKLDEYEELLKTSKSAILAAESQEEGEKAGQLIRKVAADASSLEKEIMQLIKSKGYYKDMWLGTDAFSRESNRCVRNFAVNYRMARPVCSDEQYSRLEHLRWMRFHMVNGWIYANYKDVREDPVINEAKLFRRHCKEHNCLCPYDMLAHKTDNDLTNVKIARVTRTTLSD